MRGRLLLLTITAAAGSVATLLWMLSSLDVKHRRRASFAAGGLNLSFPGRGETQHPWSEGAAEDGFVYFLHLHKAGGSFFIDLAKQEQKLSSILSSNALVWCGKLPRKLCSVEELAGGDLAPWFDWSQARQLELLRALQPSNFVANERWMGSSLLPAGTHIPGAGPLKYVVVLRNPLDRIISQFRYRQRYFHQSRTIDDFAKDPACPYVAAGFACWDANMYVQALAGMHACGGRTSGAYEQASSRAGLGCTRAQLELAKSRLGNFTVVVLDWMGSSGPLLCARLGWCSNEVQARVATRHSNCGAEKSLERHPELMQRLLERNALDLELFEYAKGVAREQLRSVGVDAPEDGGERKACAAAARRRRRL